VCYIFLGQDNIFVPPFRCWIQLDNVLSTMRVGIADEGYLRNAGIPACGHFGLTGDVNDTASTARTSGFSKSFYGVRIISTGGDS
jgi:hypothetical protein